MTYQSSTLIPSPNYMAHVFFSTVRRIGPTVFISLHVAAALASSDWQNITYKGSSEMFFGFFFGVWHLLLWLLESVETDLEPLSLSHHFKWHFQSIIQPSFFVEVETFSDVIPFTPFPACLMTGRPWMGSRNDVLANEKFRKAVIWTGIFPNKDAKINIPEESSWQFTLLCFASDAGEVDVKPSTPNRAGLQIRLGVCHGFQWTVDLQKVEYNEEVITTHSFLFLLISMTWLSVDRFNKCATVDGIPHLAWYLEWISRLEHFRSMN